MTNDTDFKPPLWLRSSNVQTALASSKLRQKLCRGFSKQAQRVVLDAGNGHQTTVYINHHPSPKGVIVLFHGWLGTPQSGYVLSAARHFHRAGFTTASLTMHEHGEAALMNPDFLDMSQHEFLRYAVRDLTTHLPDLPMGFMGFSMGGNCCLRLARDLTDHPLPTLQSVVAISPVIEPADTCDKIDVHPLIRGYFLRKFNRLYRQKQELYPDRYAHVEMSHARTIRKLTDISVAEWSSFDSTEAYFKSYRINSDDLNSCPVPVTIVSAMDDQIVLPEPTLALHDDPNLDRVMTSYGGHNGFFERFPTRMFSERVALQRFENQLDARD